MPYTWKIHCGKSYMLVDYREYVNQEDKVIELLEAVAGVVKKVTLAS